MKWKMASATNSWGISAEEYSKFAIHVYQYLSYIKGLEVPKMEQLEDESKLAIINSENYENSKPFVSIFANINILFGYFDLK